MFGYFAILGAISGFFISFLILMALWGVIAPDFGIEKIGYTKAMIINITLSLAVAPLAAAGWKRKR